MMSKIFAFLCAVGFLYADLVIFVYHRFDDPRYPSTNITTKKLRSDFSYLKKNGYEVFSVEKIAKYLKEKKKFPQKAVAFSIDDAYKSFYDNGLKVFKEFNYPFVLFFSSKPTLKGYKDFMNWDELKQASKYGTIGLHSYEHKHMTLMNNDDIIKDTKKDISLYKKHLNIAPKYFAYPYGEYNQRVKKVLSKMGYKLIFNQTMGAVSNKSDPLDLYRNAVGQNTNIKHLLKIKFLDVKWDYERNATTIKSFYGKMNSSAKKAQFFLSGYKWQNFNIYDKEFNVHVNKRLTKPRNRLIIKTQNNEYASFLIMHKRIENDK